MGSTIASTTTPFTHRTPGNANWRLTVNYGVRWEPYQAPTSKWGQIHFFDAKLFDKGYRTPVYDNAPPGVIFPGDPNYVCGKSYACSKWANFFPRVGFAFDPKGDGKMTIRASYGMQGDRTHMFYPNQMSFGPPFANRISLSGTSFSDPWLIFPGVPGFSAAGKNPMPHFKGSSESAAVQKALRFRLPGTT